MHSKDLNSYIIDILYKLKNQYRKGNVSLFLKLSQWIFLGVIGFYIYYYVTSTSIKINFSLSEFANLVKEKWVYVLILIVFSPLNSLVEAKKWQVAIKHLLPSASLVDSLKMIYVGAAAGLITPSKIGEYGGRLIGIPQKLFPQGLIANFYCSLSQNLANMILGFSAIILLSSQLYSQFQFLTVSLVTMGGVTSMVLLLMYFNLPLFVKIIEKVPLLSKLSLKINLKDSFDISVDKILQWAFLRYAIYMLQYWIVIEILNFEAEFLEKLGAIGIIFFLQSVVVLPSLLGIVARVQIAFFVWAAVGMIDGDVLLATMFLWVVNLALPAILGAGWLLLSKNQK